MTMRQKVNFDFACLTYIIINDAMSLNKRVKKDLVLELTLVVYLEGVGKEE
jgi:hypothetical protein